MALRPPGAGSWRRLWPYLARYRRSFLIGLLCIVAATGIQLLSPWVLKHAVDDLAASLAALAAQGIEPEREPYRVRDGGSLLCFVQDPDGYRIELIDRGGR